MISYKIALLFLSLSLTGCAFIKPNMTPGSVFWHKDRLQEIEQAYENKEISKAEYIQLKTNADQVVAQRRSAAFIGAMAGK